MKKNLVAQAAYAVFDPSSFACNMRPIRTGVKLLRECADYCDEQGQPHTLIVLSNWDPASFTLLQQRYEDIFSSFDHIIISGDSGLLKPHHACFNFVRTFLKQYGLNPDDCYLIDDQRVNIVAAEQCGFKGIWMQDHRMLRDQLEQAGIL